jgi:predicted transcriptional regulator
LAYGQDIFGNWVVEITYGRIGGKGPTLVTVVDNEEALKIRVEIPQKPAIRAKAHRRRLQGSYNPRFGARVDTPAMLKGNIASPTIGAIRPHRYTILWGYRNPNDLTLVNKALKKDLEQRAGQIEKIAQGIAAADRGELFDHDQVMQEMENRIEQAKNKA